MALIFDGELGIGGQELKDRNHCLTGLFADSLAVAFDKLEANGQSVVELANGRQGLGELELQFWVIRFASQHRTCGLNAADASSLKAELQLGLDFLCLGLEKPAPLQAEDPGLGVLSRPCSSAIRANPI